MATTAHAGQVTLARNAVLTSMTAYLHPVRMAACALITLTSTNAIVIPVMVVSIAGKTSMTVLIDLV